MPDSDSGMVVMIFLDVRNLLQSTSPLTIFRSQYASKGRLDIRAQIDMPGSKDDKTNDNATVVLSRDEDDEPDDWYV